MRRLTGLFVLLSALGSQMVLTLRVDAAEISLRNVSANIPDTFTWTVTRVDAKGQECDLDMVPFKPDIKALTEAAEAGDLQAQKALAKIYYTGRGVTQDKIKGYAWASIAAAGGDRPAKFLTQEIELFLTAEEKSKAQALAKDSLSKEKQQK